uniref:(northern house mosquito) hypothetical protein n=1 Tax=Culex pipiens TaxID=7175 RepID=A0A8D8F8L0_CULPI
MCVWFKFKDIFSDGIVSKQQLNSPPPPYMLRYPRDRVLRRPTRYAISTITISKMSAQPTAIGTMSGVSIASQSLAIENLALCLLWNASNCSLDTATVDWVPVVGSSTVVRLSSWTRLQW